jgi:hypothetical protein
MTNLKLGIRSEFADLAHLKRAEVEALRKAIDSAESWIVLTCREESILILRNKPNALQPYSIHHGYRRYNWIFDRNPYTWKILPDPVLANIEGNIPINWDWTAAYWELLYLVPDHPQFQQLKKHCIALTIWLSFDILPDGNHKDHLRDFLWETNLIHVKPFVDFVKAQREFVSQLYPLSQLAQRACSEVNLWFLLQWSNTAVKVNHRGVTKTTHRKEFSNLLKNFRNQLRLANKGELKPINYLPEYLNSDWIFSLESILLHEALQLIVEEEFNSALHSHCKNYLDAKSKLHNIVSHKKPYLVGPNLFNHKEPKRPGPKIGQKYK